MPAAPAFLASPEVAYVLLTVAVLGVVLEISVPGVGLGALLAAALIGLSGWALAGLGPRPVGVLLVLPAAALLVAGVFVRGRVLWCVAGGLALVLSGLVLFDQRLAAWALLLGGVAVPVAAGVLGRVVARAWRTPPYRGVAGTLVGVLGEVREGAEPGGQGRVLVAGALWKARAGQTLEPGMRVVVVAQEDLELRVAQAPRADGRKPNGQE